MKPPFSLNESDKEFYDLWMPFETKIQHLSTRVVGRADVPQNEEARRFLLKALFAERAAGQRVASIAVESFREVLHFWIERTEEYGISDKGPDSDLEAKELALESLSNQPNFLHKANHYAADFQTWLIDFFARGNSIPDGISSPTEDNPPSDACEPLQSKDFGLQTSQEAAVFLASICDGKSGKNWVNDGQAGTRTYERKGLSHFVQLRLSEEERIAGLNSEELEALTRELDTDGTFAVLYVSRLLAPQNTLPSASLAYGWIDLDDVMHMIGWTPRSSVERIEMRRQVWNYLRFCTRANLTGKRTGIYRDISSGEEISTIIDGPIWQFMKEERPLMMSLFADLEVPVRVQIAVSPEWTRLTTSAALAQFLPMGELLGCIPPDKPSGAWARALGLAIASFWRRHPQEVMSGTMLPTRHELLTAYTPKISPSEEILSGKNPRRALEYWRVALQILVNSSFISPEGEPARLQSEILSRLPRYHWQSLWLQEQVDIRPGKQMEQAVIRCAERRPTPKMRDLRQKRRIPKKPPKID